MTIILIAIAILFVYCCITDPKEKKTYLHPSTQIKPDLSNDPDFIPDQTHIWELKIEKEPWKYMVCVISEILFFEGDWKGRENTVCYKRDVNHKGHAGLARELVVHSVWLEELPEVKTYGAHARSECRMYIYCHGEQYEYLYNIGQEMKGKAKRNLRLEEAWKSKKKKLGIDHIKPGYVW